MFGGIDGAYCQCLWPHSNTVNITHGTVNTRQHYNLSILKLLGMSTRNRIWKISSEIWKMQLLEENSKNGLWLELKTMFRLFHCIFYVAVFCRDVLFWKSGGTNLAQIAASNCFQETHKLCTPPHLRVWECLSLIDSVRDAVKNYLADFFLLRVYPRPPPAPLPP